MRGHRRAQNPQDCMAGLPSTVMAAQVAAIHFPETKQCLRRFWKMDGRD
jgi:hypothetical protein